MRAAISPGAPLLRKFLGAAISFDPIRRRHARSLVWWDYINTGGPLPGAAAGPRAMTFMVLSPVLWGFCPETAGRGPAIIFSSTSVGLKLPSVSAWVGCAQAGTGGGPLDHAGEAGLRERRSPLADEDEGRCRALRNAVKKSPRCRFHLQLWRRSAGVLGSAFPVIDLCSRVADRVRKRRHRRLRKEPLAGGISYLSTKEKIARICGGG
jgi:hypothetical protein